VEKKRPVLIGLISDSVSKIPENCSCPCGDALNGAEVKPTLESEDL